MGEVYRARHPRLDRDVALKALPDAFSQDPDRLLRFEREARCSPRSITPTSPPSTVSRIRGIRFLVVELVEGPTLAERLIAGPLPVEEALRSPRESRSASRRRTTRASSTGT